MKTWKAQLFSPMWGNEKLPLMNCSEVDFNRPWDIYFRRDFGFVGERGVVKEK